MGKHKKDIAALAVAALLGFGGGVAGSALHPGKNGTDGKVNYDWVATIATQSVAMCTVKKADNPDSVYNGVPVVISTNADGDPTYGWLYFACN